MRLSAHLKRLESESIHIFREVAAEFEHPVLMVSALKVFYPAKLPFPLLHIDTTWTSKEMITETSGHQGRMINQDQSGSMENIRREGYF